MKTENCHKGKLHCVDNHDVSILMADNDDMDDEDADKGPCINYLEGGF